MKKFDELNTEEKARAVGFAYNHLTTCIMSGEVIVTFKNQADNLLLLAAMRKANKAKELSSISELFEKRQSIRDELMESAQIAAEAAYYSDPSDYIVEGVVK